MDFGILDQGNWGMGKKGKQFGTCFVLWCARRPYLLTFGLCWIIIITFFFFPLFIITIHPSIHPSMHHLMLCRACMMYCTLVSFVFLFSFLGIGECESYLPIRWHLSPKRPCLIFPLALFCVFLSKSLYA
ncbi:hypothetical protein DFH27DRAFT_79031 [Peziza echinospora]|nr:hypothetical protein DFH27DRAFT_79031 [Peziza echinospora]